MGSTMNFQLKSFCLCGFFFFIENGYELLAGAKYLAEKNV